MVIWLFCSPVSTLVFGSHQQLRPLCSFCVKWKKSLFDANQSIKMWSSLQTFGVLWFKSTVPQKVLWRWRCTCVIKKIKSNKRPQTGETDNIKGKDAEKAAPGTDWEVEGSSLNIRRFRCSAEKREKGEGRVCNGSSWRPECSSTRLMWRRWNNSKTRRKSQNKKRLEIKSLHLLRTKGRTWEQVYKHQDPLSHSLLGVPEFPVTHWVNLLWRPELPEGEQQEMTEPRCVPESMSLVFLATLKQS